MEKSLLAQLHTALISWHKTTDERAKLQHSYVALAVLLVIVAGLVGLMNYSYGQSLLQLALGAFIIFAANAIIWALLQSFVFTRLEAKARINKRSK